MPAWYEQALWIGADAHVSMRCLTSLFEDGISRFPGYDSIYFAYGRSFVPRWGGSYATADAFIRAAAASKTNPEGEALYTRLYWLLDQYNGQDQDFFTASRVRWPRMRAGFEPLIKRYPSSAWNQANLVIYACRTSDGASYYKWRKTVDARQFVQAAPQGISPEVAMHGLRRGPRTGESSRGALICRPNRIPCGS